MPRLSMAGTVIALVLQVLAPAGAAAQEISDEFTKTYRAYDDAFTRGNLQRAAELAAAALDIARTELGPEHEKTAIMHINLGHVLLLTGEADEAEPELRRAQAIIEKLHGPGHKDLATVHEDLAKIHAARKELDRAREEQAAAIAVTAGAWGEDHPHVAELLLQQALLDVARGKPGDAEAALQRALNIRAGRFGAESPQAAAVLVSLGDLELYQQHFVKAEQYYTKGLQVFEKELVADDPRIIGTHTKLANMYIAMDNDQFEHHADRVIALMDDVDGKATPLFVVKPKLGDAGRQAQGWALMEFTVTEAGRISNARIIESLPPTVFDQAMLVAARKWRFKPRVEQGKRVKQAGTRARVVFRGGQVEVHVGEMK